MSLRSDFLANDFYPQLQGLENQSPICIDASRLVWLDVEAQDDEGHTWTFKMTSNTEQAPSAVSQHVSGKIRFRSANDKQFHADFARFERFVGHERCVDLLNNEDADDIMQGRNIYKTFGEIVDYGEKYRGVQKLVGRGSESAGRVVFPYTAETWLDTPVSDCFCQVAGIFVNCMTDRVDSEMFIATGAEQWIRSPKLKTDTSRPDTWDVYATHQKRDKAWVSDVFIFDPRDGSLLEVILGINYQKLPKQTMTKLLVRLTPGAESTAAAGPSAAALISAPAASVSAPKAAEPSGGKKKKTKKVKRTVKVKKSGGSGGSGGSGMLNNVKGVLAGLTGLEVPEIKDDADLAEIGMDSLMGMEMARDIETAFDCTLDMERLADVTTLPQLMEVISLALGIEGGSAGGEEEVEEEIEEEVEVTDDEDDAAEPAAEATKTKGITAETDLAPEKELNLPRDSVLKAFGESKALTDKFIEDCRCADYMDTVLPRQTQFCVALALEAFEKLGCSVKTAKPGEKLDRIPHIPNLQRLANYLYKMLEKEARLIDIFDSEIIRTGVSAPSKSSSELLQGLLRDYPDHSWANKLCFLTGSNLAEVLTGEVDGIKLIWRVSPEHPVYPPDGGFPVANDR